MAQGKSGKQVARELYISENTVRNHTANIYKKLQINDRTRAVLHAVRMGLVDPGALAASERETRAPESAQPSS